MIDIVEKVRLVCPDIPHSGDDVDVNFEGTGKRSGDVVVLQVDMKYRSSVLVDFDLWTKEMHLNNWCYSFLEVNLASRLETMKTFS